MFSNAHFKAPHGGRFTADDFLGGAQKRKQTMEEQRAIMAGFRMSAQKGAADPAAWIDENVPEWAKAKP